MKRSPFYWECIYCHQPIAMEGIKYVNKAGEDSCLATESGNGKGPHEPVIYKLVITGREFNYAYKPSYDKAVKRFELYHNGCVKCVQMAAKFSERLKLHIERGNSMDDAYGKQLYASYERWDSMLNSYLSGHVTKFMLNINKMKVEE